VAPGSPDLKRILTFGGQAPLSVGALIAAMVVATVGGTLWPPLGELLSLQIPGEGAAPWLTALEAWRLLTWPFFQGHLGSSVLTLLFGGFMLLWLGRQLSYAWTERRFLIRFFVLTGGAGLATLLVLLPFGGGGGYAGIWPVLNALLVTWGLIFPNQRLSWFGALEMTGATVAKVVTIATPLWALAVAPAGVGILGRLLAYLPHLVAIGMAWLLVAGGPRRGWYRVKDWWLRRDLDRQRRKFKVVTTDRAPPGGWVN
jgi:hypothetical protein